jgi:lysophospholipase L1-like esterase
MAGVGRRLVLLVTALVALACTSSTQATPVRSVLHYGDSLAVGTGIYLDAFLRGWSVQDSFDESRHTDEAPGDLRAFGPALPRVIVISLGANDAPSARTWFERQVRAVLRIAGPARCVIWSTVVRPPYRGVPYTGLNAVLRRLDRGNTTLHVFDWAAMAKAHPTWFGPDGVHPSMTGYRARAAAIAQLARRC